MIYINENFDSLLYNAMIPFHHIILCACGESVENSYQSVFASQLREDGEAAEVNKLISIKLHLVYVILKLTISFGTLFR